MTKEELDYANDCITQAAKLLADSYVFGACRLVDSEGYISNVCQGLDEVLDRIATFIRDNNPVSEPINIKSEEHFL